MKMNKYAKLIIAVFIGAVLVSCNRFTDSSNTNKEIANNLADKTSEALRNSSEKLSDISKIYEKLDMSKSKFEKGYYDYEGIINNNLPIQMSIYPLTRELVGSYFYEKHKKEIKLQGKADEKNIVLYEYDENHKNTGVFRGTMNTVDEIQGEWMSSDGKNSYPFKLSLKSILPGVEYSKRYSVAVGKYSDQEVENFANKVQGYIVDNNKEKLAEQINYPISVTSNNNVIKIESKDEFVKNYDKILNTNFKQQISNSYGKYMFANYQGVMFGGNQYNMWINEVTLNDGTSKLMITDINN